MGAASSERLLGRLQPFGIQLGLERMHRLLAALGNPHLEVRRVLVAGTNGKGSTAALLAAICRAAGYRTGLYTSPHLESVRERFQVDGVSIEDHRLASYLAKSLEVADQLGGEPPTSFEALTLASLLYFREAKVDLAVMEVGLGGRLDATNVGTPELSIITPIGLDHERHLGHSLESIAVEKSGILRSIRPAIAWTDDEQVRRVLIEQAERVGAELTFVDSTEVAAATPSTGAFPQRVSVKTAHDAYELDLFLAGKHQLGNLHLAVRAAELLSERGWTTLDRDAIQRGVARCRWAGRLEWVPLADGRRVLLDAGHNAAGLATVIEYISQLQEPPNLLFGALEEKSLDEVLPRLAAGVGRVVLTQPSADRPAAPDRWFRHFAGKGVEIEMDPRRALERALAECSGSLLVCGSFFLIGRVRGWLRQRFGVPADLLSQSSSVASPSVAKRDQGRPS